MKATHPGFTIANQYFAFGDGIYGVTVVWNKDIYYAALAGSKIYKMETSKTSKCLPKSETNALTKLAATLSGQTETIALMSCALFFSDIEKTSIVCADTTKEINSQNMGRIAQDSEMLQFPSSLKTKRGKLMILSNRYQQRVHNTLNIREVNFRILSMSNIKIQKKTKCFASCPVK